MLKYSKTRTKQLNWKLRQNFRHSPVDILFYDIICGPFFQQKKT